jgi:hypothetical protein
VVSQNSFLCHIFWGWLAHISSDASDSDRVNIPLVKLTETFSSNEENSQTADEKDTTPLDQIGHGLFQEQVALHDNAEDVTIVAAQAGSEDTNWIDDFCED